MTLMELLLCYVLTLLCALPMARAAERVLGPAEKLPLRVAVYLLFCVTLVLPCRVGDNNPVLLFPFFMAAFLLCYAGAWQARLVAGGIFYTLLLSLDMLLDTIDLWTTKGLSFVTPFFAVKLLAWLLLGWLIRRGIPGGGVRLSPRLWRLLGGLTLAPLAVTLSFSLWNYWDVAVEAYEPYAMALYRIGFTTLPFAFLAALALLFTAILFARHETLERESFLAEQRESYYENLKREQTQVRTLRHDLRNHLTAVAGLLDAGETARAEDYLAALADSPALGGGRRYCENETANVVLSSKAAAMEAEGLEADFSLSLPEALPLTAPELCALMGNALDNAIEAARKAENKRITLRARVEKGLLMLRVENALGGPVRPDLGTTKPDVGAHGLGLAGMRELVSRRGGSLEARAEDGNFVLTVCLPCL